MKASTPMVIAWLLTLSVALSAQTDPAALHHAGFFRWTPELKATFEDLLNLRLQKTAPIIQTACKEDHFNLLPHYLEDYLDFYLAFLDGNLKTIQGKYLERKDERLLWLEQGSEQDPYTLYTQADVHLRWGMIYALYQDNIEAFKSLKKAAALLERNEKRFPDFVPNRRAWGILHTMVGAIPGKYQWGASLAGLKGDIRQGLTELQAVIDHGKRYPDFVFNRELQQLYGMILLYLGTDDLQAWGALNTQLLDPVTSPMATYILASRYLRTGKSRKALLLLEERRPTEDQHPFPYLDLMLGNCYLYRLDKEAGQYFNRFLENCRGTNGIKEAYHHLAWLALLDDAPNQYSHYMKQVERKGTYFTGPDRTAMNEMQAANAGKMPNLHLLQARLLYDGGYYDKAYQAWQRCALKDIKDEEARVEYYYRQGRILQQMRRKEEALDAFDKTIQQGTKKPYYYACNAALQAGLVCEALEDWERAQSYYQHCLKEKPDQYKASLHAKAKQRLEVLAAKR